MLTPAEREEVEKRLATAKQCFLEGTIPTIAQAARDNNVNEG
jgi:hypothetical protein